MTDNAQTITSMVENERQKNFELKLEEISDIIAMDSQLLQYLAAKTEKQQ
ncbi:5098_t:CDS:2 [Funneliformis caledonium]|uniref:5098_t:CDS:1 n=1 Tax=Funneliformis caledonium TaxID=1117310 RepID=A0A9N9CLM3_9GLOM|nr:5098_t:CDS:2 [Funneliformis caledonium]